MYAVFIPSAAATSSGVHIYPVMCMSVEVGLIPGSHFTFGTKWKFTIILALEYFFDFCKNVQIISIAFNMYQNHPAWRTITGKHDGRLNWRNFLAVKMAMADRRGALPVFILLSVFSICHVYLRGPKFLSGIGQVALLIVD